MESGPKRRLSVEVPEDLYQEMESARAAEERSSSVAGWIREAIQEKAARQLEEVADARSARG